MLIEHECIKLIINMFSIADSIGINLLAPDCLLTGVGNELHQYYLEANNTVHRKISLKFRSKIYGIAKFDGAFQLKPQFVIVYGGRDAAILEYGENNNLRLVTQLTLSDFISSVRVYKPVTNEVSFSIVFAHSVITEFKVNASGKWSIENKATCVDKCTLYSSLIIGDSWDETTIFGGTAFGELIIWKAAGDNEPREILHRLSGHNGVIFSINCSIAHNLITTTSDDRSVKIWNVKFATESDWSDCTIEASKSMYGHTARIFSHKIIEYDDKVFIISVGEDGNVCVWAPDGRLVNRSPISDGISLWNLDYDSKKQYLFACGNDGNVHQLNLSKILNETQILCANVDAGAFDEGEYVEKFVVMQTNAIAVMLTNKQKLLYGEIVDNMADFKWTLLPGAETEYKITALETFGSLVATAGYEFMTIYRFENGQFEKVFHDKPPSMDRSLLRSLKFISADEFVICDSRGNGSIITTDEQFNIVKNQQFQLPACKERWITVAARFENFMVVGDRHGSIHLFEIGDSLDLKHTLWRVHGNLGCKTIFRSSSSGNRLEFESAGHQGKLKTIVINRSTHELELKSTNEIPIKWCDKAIQIDQSVLLAGFNERHFVAWQTDRSYRFEFDCGGGHRAWDLYVDNRTSRAHLFFVRSKLLNCVQFDLHDGSLHPFNISTTNWHSRPCNTMHIIELTEQRFLVASGGDDNLLKFSEITLNNSDQSVLKHNLDMILHISNIRSVFALQTQTSDENWLVFSGGGRAQICVTQVQIDQQRNVQFNEMCDFMLRSSDLQRKRTKHTQIIHFDPETRFMSLFAYFDSNEIRIVVGCSDGFIRTFTYSNGSISLNASAFYGRCILNVYHFTVNDHNYLITMATDGLIAFWSLDKFNEESKPFFTVSHHDSGINSYDVFIDCNKMFVATGGDDQAIVVSILQIDEQTGGKEIDISVVRTERFPYSHTAQVNGVRFSKDQKYLYSSSVDQTVMKIVLDNFLIEQAAYSCISDAKGLQILNSNHVLVYGCGMQILNV